MKKTWFGDTYDIAKRFMIEAAKNLFKSEVDIDPMLNDNFENINMYYKFLNGTPIEKNSGSLLFIDPDKGVAKKDSTEHINYKKIQMHAMNYKMIMIYDQSFSRAKEQGIKMQMKNKLEALNEFDLNGIYYRSHVNFLFCSYNTSMLANYKSYLIEIGLPYERFFENKK
ncbi:MAG: hypothetical protein JEZ08_25135 [Clostridiales bacterium]|nr:hypothetical protein [Clostridiales bacterium]